MARQDYTGGDRGQMERQQAAAEAVGRPDVDYGGGDVFVGGAGSGGTGGGGGNGGGGGAEG